MFKITSTPDRDRGVLLKLEGKLLEPWLGELSGAYRAPRVGPTAVRLDLSALSYADEPGVRALKALIRQGVTIAATSAFVATLLGLEDRCTSSNLQPSRLSPVGWPRETTARVPRRSHR